MSEGEAATCRDTAIHVASARDLSPGIYPTSPNSRASPIPKNVTHPGKMGRLRWAEGTEGTAVRG